MARAVSNKDELDTLEKDLEEVKRRFDMYFQGSKEQRTPPTNQQVQMGGILRRMREDDSRNWNTQDKFRLNQIHARFVSMDRMWARTLRQVEDGTHRRDKFKVERRKEAEVDPAAKRPRPVDVPEDTGFDVDIGGFEDDDLLNVSRPPQVVTKPRPLPSIAPAQASAAAAAPGLGGMSEQRLKQLYDVYIQAKKKTGESSSLTLDALRSQIVKQVPNLQEKHNTQNIDFKVVLKDGQAMLKPVPKGG
jgi:Asp-tRNA(Asn)/Glu-tRNA(Gln) amidotransferase C subunit